MTKQQQLELEAAAFRSLRDWLQQRDDVQNIDLMILAGFCRNCMAKWYRKAAEDRGLTMDYAQAQELVYGIPYSEWKQKHQTPASPEKLEQLAKVHKPHD